MTDNRIIDISEHPARLSVRQERLVIEREDAPDTAVPLAELAALAVSNPRVSFTHAALSKLSAAGGVLVVCDEKHLPAGMLIPVAAHYTQSERFARQAEAPLPLKKRLWRQVVRHKVENQGKILEELYQDDKGLKELSKKVKSGDPENIEAVASQRYWPALFDDPGFKRDRSAEDQNRYLNYGYAVLRAVIARAICAAGLHPSLGIHHHNRYDSFCLADDLMEPYRPLVDRAVVEVTNALGPDAPMDKHAKAPLIEAVAGKVSLRGEERSVFDAAARMASSLAAVFAGKKSKLDMPEI